MLGIVLCGGQSVRMGADKGLMHYGDTLWAKVMMDKMSALGIPVRLSVNAAQKEAYSSHFQHGQLIVDDPSIAVKGPLLGILSAHMLAPEEDLFLLACDMVLMEEKVLTQLMRSFAEKKSCEACIFTKDGLQEPLCGIYTAAGLKKIMGVYLDQGIAKPSMKMILNDLHVLEIPLKKEDYLSFSNFNSPDEASKL